MTNEKTLPTGFKAFGIVRRSDNFALPPISWAHWGNMYDVELWQAAALSLNINPDTIKDPDRFDSGEYINRLRLLVNWLAPQKRVMICELAGKWSKVLKWQIPPELAAKAAIYNAYRDTAAPAETNAPAAKGKAGTDVSAKKEPLKKLAQTWWRTEYDILTMAQSAGDSLRRKSERTSNRNIGNAVALDIEQREKRGKKREAPDGQTIKNTDLYGWKYEAE